MGQRAALRRAAAAGLAVLGLSLCAVSWGADAPSTTLRTSSRVPQPVIEPASGGQCVQEAAFMRRNHMAMLKHDRDTTVRAGARDTKYSLKACIGCHASKTSGSVNAAPGDFCQSCHSYSAVKIDCFECHSGKPAPGQANAAAKP